jgi:tol-pal system protein YbgF
MFVSDTGCIRCLAAAVLVTAAALAAPASAQQRLSLSERVERLEQQASGRGGAQGSIELVNQVQALQSQVQVLQGQIEELRHQLSEAQGRAKDQYIDLDSRIGRIEGRSGGAAAPAASPGPADQGLKDIELGTPPQGDTNSLTPDDAQLAPPEQADNTAPLASDSPGADLAPDAVDPEAEKRAYDEAFSALKDGRYSESARRFQAFIAQYPDGDLTGNAYYWLGESYYVTQNYRVALETFGTLLSRFPQNQKVPDALLKTGYCQYELKQWDAAEATLNSVIETYPNTTVARLAQGRLRALTLENRR